MQEANIKLIERTPGYTNEMMVRECENLLAVINKTIDTKNGKQKKYKFDEDVSSKIHRSYEHYKALCEQETNVDTSFDFRDYQKSIIDESTERIYKHGFVYLAMEVRTGKTLTSLGIASKIGAKNVLFITKKKAISSIESDYKLLSPSYNLIVINYESLHTVMDDHKWDLVICDEAHSMGAFPKPSQRAELVRDLIRKHKPKVILLSGTPTPESYSQMYHQVYGIPGNPFQSFSNFYRFCDEYVSVKRKKVNGMFINDYSKGKETILKEMEKHTICYTQKAAGFSSTVEEEILEVEIKESTRKMIKRLSDDLVIKGKDEVILADTAVKLMMKTHQLFSGTIKFESGNSMVIDTSKAEFIKKHFDGCKIGIFYKFKEELTALKQVFGDEITTELSVFDDTDKSIALQIVSGREGISLRNAEFLVYYNIDFSATSYWQSKDRMTTKDRPENKVYWVFAKGGIEYDIYDSVTKKKDYTVSHFKNFNV